MGVREILNGGGNPASSKTSAKGSYPSKLFQAYSKLANPEELEDGDRWEEDTNDTEIMRNINSLLDSDLYEYNDSASVQIKCP